MSPWECSLWTNGPISRKHFNWERLCIYLRNSIDIMSICLIVQFQLFSRFHHIMTICSHISHPPPPPSMRNVERHFHINTMYIFIEENVKPTKGKESESYSAIVLHNDRTWNDSGGHFSRKGSWKTQILPHLLFHVKSICSPLLSYVPIIVDSNTGTHAYRQTIIHRCAEQQQQQKAHVKRNPMSKSI